MDFYLGACMLSRLTSQVVYCNLCYLAASELTRQAFYCY